MRAIGYGPTDRLKDGICHIAVYTKHVNIGFNKGALLPDPQKLLHGTGKWIRHITVRSKEELRNPAIREYLRRAKQTSSSPAKQSPGVQSVVKAIYARRKRPGST